MCLFSTFSRDAYRVRKVGRPLDRFASHQFWYRDAPHSAHPFLQISLGQLDEAVRIHDDLSLYSIVIICMRTVNSRLRTYAPQDDAFGLSIRSGAWRRSAVDRAGALLNEWRPLWFPTRRSG